MTRRLHSCRTCAGRTRHRAVCGPCRRRGVTFRGDEICVPITLRLVSDVADIRAPRLSELEKGLDLAGFLARPTTLRLTRSSR